LSQQNAAAGGNRVRFEQANEDDVGLLSKYVFPDTPFVCATTHDEFKPLLWLLESIQAVARMDVTTPSKPNIMFEISKEATQLKTAGRLLF
jgi:hypothetical protein